MKNNKGFSLIELLIVLTIVAVVGSLILSVLPHPSPVPPPAPVIYKGVEYGMVIGVYQNQTTKIWTAKLSEPDVPVFYVSLLDSQKELVQKMRDAADIKHRIQIHYEGTDTDWRVVSIDN